MRNASTAESAPRRVLRADAPVVALAFALVLVSLLTQFRGPIDLRDEAYLWYGAIHVVKGGVPLRDFQSYDPGRYYWTAPWMLFDTGIVPLRMACSTLQFFGVLCGLLVLRRLTRSWLALTAAGALLTLWLVPLYMPNHTVALVGVWLAVRLIEAPSPLRWLVAGIFAGLSAFVARNLGLYALVSFSLLGAVLWWKVDERDLVRRLLAFGTGIVVGYAPMLVMFVAVPGFWKMNLYTLRAQVEAGTTTNLNLPVPWPWVVSSTWERCVGVFFVLSPVLYALATAWIAGAKRERLLRGRVILAATVVGLPFLHYAFSRADVQHLAMGIHPLLIGLLALPFIVGARWRSAVVASLLTVAAISVVAAGKTNPTYQRMTAPPGRIVETTVGGWRLWMPLPMAVFIEGAARFNATMVRPDEGFLIVPHIGGGLYCILNRDTPIWQTYFLFPEPEWWQREMIEQFERSRVAWVLLDDVRPDGHEELRFRHTHRLLWEHIMAEFDPFPVDGLPKDMVMLHRRNAPAP